MSYVVTGCTGHIGNNLVRYLVGQHEDVKVLVRRVDKSIDALNVEYAIGDIFNKEFLNNHINQGDIVIHLAGIIDIKNKLEKETNEINFIGTKTITDVCLEKKVKHYVYCSSVDAIYKENEDDEILEPTKMEPDKFSWNYPKSKAKATEYVLNKMNESHDTNISIVYPSAVFGIHDYKPSYVGKVIMDAINGKMEFGVKGGYNFIDVIDVVKAIYQASLKTENGSYILSGNNVTVFEMYDTINKALGKKKKVWKIPLFIAKMAIPFVPYLSNFTFLTLLENHNYNNNKAKEELGLVVTPFEDTVKNTVEWFKENLNEFKRKSK